MDILMNSVLVLFGLGLVTSVVLSVASVVLRVEEDPRVEAVAEALPGANCGGCGFAGCDSYAAAVVNDPKVGPDKCVACNAETAAQIGVLTGKAVCAGEPQVSFRRCVKTEGKVKKKFAYQGVTSCAAAARLQNGPDACRFSCLGFGDCMRACPFDAMFLHDDLVWIIAEKCTSCGVCVRTCPHDILEIIPQAARVQVYCSSQDKGKAVKDVCEAGCIACGMCVKKCPAGAVSERNGRIYIDHAKCIEYGPSCEEVCAEKCPRSILRRMQPGAQKAEEAA
jgi:electron transport complex protein RnfB